MQQQPAQPLRRRPVQRPQRKFESTSASNGTPITAQEDDIPVQMIKASSSGVFDNVTPKPIDVSVSEAGQESNSTSLAGPAAEKAGEDEAPKKVRFNKRAKKLAAAQAAAEAAAVSAVTPVEEDSDVITTDLTSPYLDLVYKRTRALRKRLRKIEAYENEAKLGTRTLNTDQELACAARPSIAASLQLLDDLRNQYDTLDKDLRTESAARVKKAVATAVAARDNYWEERLSQQMRYTLVLQQRLLSSDEVTEVLQDLPTEESRAEYETALQSVAARIWPNELKPSKTELNQACSRALQTLNQLLSGVSSKIEENSELSLNLTFAEVKRLLDVRVKALYTEEADNTTAVSLVSEASATEPNVNDILDAGSSQDKPEEATVASELPPIVIESTTAAVVEAAKESWADIEESSERRRVEKRVLADDSAIISLRAAPSKSPEAPTEVLPVEVKSESAVVASSEANPSTSSFRGRRPHWRGNNQQYRGNYRRRSNATAESQVSLKTESEQKEGTEHSTDPTSTYVRRPHYRSRGRGGYRPFHNNSSNNNNDNKVVPVVSSAVTLSNQQ